MLDTLVADPFLKEISLELGSVVTGKPSRESASCEYTHESCGNHFGCCGSEGDGLWLPRS